MNKDLKPINFDGTFLDSDEQWLLDHAQAVFYNLMDCLKWFVEDDIGQLYDMIENNMGIDEWYVEMSHRIENYDDTYYILEEEDLMKFRGIMWKE